MTSSKPRPPLIPGETRAYPVLPLRDIVVFPHVIAPLFVGRKKSILALEEAMRSDTFILLATQKNASDDDPATEAIYEVGTLASVLQLLKLPDGTVKVLVEGAQRAKVVKYTDCSEYYQAEAVALGDTMGERVEAKALARSVTNEFESYVKLNKRVPPEVVGVVQQIEDYAKLADTVASHLALKIPDKQLILETPSVIERLEKVLGLMESEISVLQVDGRLDECEPSDPPLTRDVDGEIFDTRLLNRLRIEFHQLHDLERHTYFDGEAQFGRFTGGKRVIMRPMSAGKLCRKGLRCRPLHPWRQQLYCPTLDLGESLLSHISEDQREVEDALNGLRVTSFDDARGRESGNLRIDRTEHRELAQHDLVGSECNQRSARHGIDRNIDGYFCLMRFHGAGDLHRSQHEATGRVDHQVDRHIVGRFFDRRNDRLGILQIDVPGDGKSEKAALLLTMDHRDNTRRVRLFKCADRLRASHGIPSPHE